MRRVGTWMRWGALGLFLLGCEQAAPVPRYAEADRGGDRDEDGAPDLDDACPDDAEDGLAPKANDGCPDSDTDEDGISLADDRCPDAKEDGEAPAPSDGCPAKDSDGDGVSDGKDECADQAEDNVAPKKSDGCPALDQDKDGIADLRDRCPTDPESVNGFRDVDGCPDSAPAGDVAYDVESQEIWVAESKKLRFAPGTAELAPESRTTLVEVAKVLKEHPEIFRLEIEAHSNSQGDEKLNVDMTQRRANAVVQDLVSNGIAQARLVPIGYGEYCPVADKGDEVAEPKNERVAMKAVFVKGVWQTIPRGCWRAKAKGVDPTKRGLKKKTPISVPSTGV
jgi:outer membrane protein OmpA-like peptidoglycan-associated protein